MRSTYRPDFQAAVLAPEPGDDPGDLEDAIHDELLRRRQEGQALAQVVLDLSGIAAQGPWLKAAGPESPDTNLRVALGAQGFLAARALRLDAVFEWYPDVEAALRAAD
ncbi:MAG: hypothetical protein AB7N76_08070 [Planctomycetota bacterium]